MKKANEMDVDHSNQIWLKETEEFLEETGICALEAEEMAQWALENEILDLDNLPEEYLKAKKETQEDEDFKLMVRVN